MRRNHSEALTPLIGKLERMRDECLGQKKDPEEGLDDFTKVKKRAAKRIKETRTMLKRRDALFRVNKADPNAVKLSVLIRSQIAEIMSMAEDMQTMYLAEKAKWDKKKQKEKDKAEGMEQLLSNREDIVRLTFLHVQEIEMLERQRSEEAEQQSREREQLFELREVAHDTKSGSYGIVDLPPLSAFPDLEVQEGFGQQEANEVRINNMLDQVLDGVIDLKELATAMGTQIEQTDVIIDNLDMEVSSANTNVDNLNTRLKGLLMQARSPKQLCVDICAIILFIILVGLLIKVIKDRYG